MTYNSPSAGLWRGWFIGALGFSRVVHFVLDFKDSEVTGTYSATLFHDGRRASGTVKGTFKEERLTLTASTPDLMGSTPDAFTLDLTYFPGPPEAAYGTVTGKGDYARLSGIIRMRVVPPLPRTISSNGGGWADETGDQG